jgi:hypothetical protein
MPDDNHHTLTDAEYHELTKAGRRKYPSTDPIHQPPPEPANPDDYSVEDFLRQHDWRHR